jgi:hypothetical protein
MRSRQRAIVLAECDDAGRRDPHEKLCVAGHLAKGRDGSEGVQHGRRRPRTLRGHNVPRNPMYKTVPCHNPVDLQSEASQIRLATDPESIGPLSVGSGHQGWGDFIRSGRDTPGNTKEGKLFLPPWDFNNDPGLRMALALQTENSHAAWQTPTVSACRGVEMIQSRVSFKNALTEHRFMGWR